MLGWFKRKPREIFGFRDGARTRYVDPMLILRTLNARPSFNEDLAIVDKDDEFGRSAYQSCLSAIREAFGIRPLTEDGSGMTEEETWGVFSQYTAYLDSLKKN